MSRIWSCGFELNATSTVELDFITASKIQGIVVRSGTYAFKASANNDEARIRWSAANNGQGVIFIRFYLYIDTSFFDTKEIAAACTFSGVTDKIGFKLTSANKLQLFDFTNVSQIGSDSPALTSATWYRIELSIDTTTLASTVVEARIGGVSFASGTVNQDFGPTGFRIFDAQSVSGIYYVDDIAVNDNSSPGPTSWVGDSKIIHLRPSATGDSTQWIPDSESNYARVNEITPDDATSLVSDVILNDSDLYNVDNSGIGASDTVNVVAVGVRFRNDVADATTAFKVQIEKVSGGTISQSAAITPNSTTWKTNAVAVPRNYPLVLYQDPDSSNWTQATLDTMQIGVQSTAIGVNKNQISTIWALVDYTPAGGEPTGVINPLYLRSLK